MPESEIAKRRMNLFMASEREYKDGSMYLRASICLSSLSFLHLVFLVMTMALGFDPEARLMVGLNYKLGGNTVVGGKRTFDKRNYFSVSVGPSLFSETILVDHYRKVSVGADLSFGRWFTSASGMEIGLGYDFIAPHTSKTLCLGTAHVDYLLNLTSLLEPDPDRRFHLRASLGTGI